MSRNEIEGQVFEARRKNGFTLLELLVVIAIIAILAAILFPVFAVARERARATACLSNSKQLATAIHMYTQDYDEKLFPYAFRNAANTAWTHGWQIVVVPYIKSSQVFICPSARKLSTMATTNCDPTNVGMTIGGNSFGSGSYGYNYYYLGNYTTGPVANPAALSAINKPSETVAAAEINGLAAYGVTYHPTLWGNPYTGCGAATYGDGVATWHMEGNNVVFVDGHAKWMKKTTMGDSDGNGTRDDGFYDLN